MYIMILFIINYLFLNQVCAGRRPARAWFLELLLSVTLVRMCVCVHVCVPAPKAINYIYMILNLYKQPNKFLAFRNVTKLSMYGRGLCNEACRDRNQSNKAMLVP